MTAVGDLSDKEFEANYPVDFGKGIRGQFIAYRKKIAGIVLCHRRSSTIGCACSVFWIRINKQRVYTKLNSVPLTIEEDIRCDCGLHGWIKEGLWEYAHDSR